MNGSLIGSMIAFLLISSSVLFGMQNLEESKFTIEFKQKYDKKTRVRWLLLDETISFDDPFIFSLNKIHDTQRIKELLKNSEGYRTDIFGNNVLHNAVFYHYPIEVIKTILVARFNVNQVNDYGWNPLGSLIVRVACQNEEGNEKKILNFFVKYGIDLYTNADDGSTVFRLAEDLLASKYDRKHIKDFLSLLVQHRYEKAFENKQKEIERLLD